MTSLREKYAELAHNMWSGWMVYLFGKCYSLSNEDRVIPKDSVDRWVRQMTTDYADLPESEKESDRVEADKMLAIHARAHFESDERDALVLLLLPLSEMVGWRVGFVDDKEDKDKCHLVIDMPSGQVCFRVPKYKLKAEYRHPIYAGKLEDTEPDNATVIYNSIGSLLPVNSLQLMRCQHLANHPNSSSGEVLVLSHVSDANTTALELCNTCAKSVENPILRSIIDRGVRDAVSNMVNNKGKSLFGYKIVME